MNGEKRTHDVILHIRVPGIHADDLPGLVAEFADDGATVLDILSEDIAGQVTITLLTHDGDLAAHSGDLVGAEIVERDALGVVTG